MADAGKAKVQDAKGAYAVWAAQYDRDGLPFRPVIDRLRSAGLCEIVEESPLFRPFVLDKDDARTTVIVLRKT